MAAPVFPSSLVTLLREARSVTALTGAGISAESGVPTFRDAQTGLWARYDPQELATADAFRRNPQLVWEWYEWRRHLAREAVPNPGHHALAAMERRAPHFSLITQNIDGLHAAAGSRYVIELHGNIHRNKCFEENVVVSEVPHVDGAVPPRCPRCGAHLRPDVVWFGETLPLDALKAALKAVETCDLFLCIGTSALVHPAAALPLQAVQKGAITVEVNIAETAVSPWMDFRLRGPAGEILPALLQETWPEPLKG